MADKNSPQQAAEKSQNALMEKIVALCKRRGFIFQSSEIYGGLNGFWDYGPLGAELKRNVKDAWWRRMVYQRDDVAGLEATIIMHPKIWEASGHVATFSDPMVDCRCCKRRFRADQVEALSGLVFTFHGATNDEGKGDASEIKILVQLGKPKESAEKVARRFYEDRGIANPKLHGGQNPERIENSMAFCSECGGQFGDPQQFNLMFRTFVGASEPAEVAYLRPETAQAIFAQFKNVLETSRQRVPFGIAQIGKAFRNEVTPRNFTFRSREFEQMELEFFIKPDEAVEAICGNVARPAGPGHPGEPQPNWGWQIWHQYWVEERIRFYESIGLPRTTLEEYWQKPEELAHYARACVDLLFKFPFGTQELEGIAARSDFDLSQHQRFSGKPMNVFDEELKAAWPKLDATKQQELTKRYYEARLKYLTKMGEAADKVETAARADADNLGKGYYVPHVIEPSAGVDRLILALIANAYAEDHAPDEKGNLETRVVMRFSPCVSPIKVAVFPLLKNKPPLVEKAKEVFNLLRGQFPAFYDEAGAIGRRYRRQDEAGTPFCVTIDFDTLGEKGPELKDTVTLRDRDTLKQERVAIKELPQRIAEAIR